MDELYIFSPKDQYRSSLLESMIKGFKSNFLKVINVSNINEYNFRYKKILIPLELDNLGYDLAMFRFLKEISKNTLLEDSTGAILIHSSTDLYTKRAAQDIIYNLNLRGMNFIGHPLIEATQSLYNFRKWSNKLKLSLTDTAIELSKRLGESLLLKKAQAYDELNILTLYSTPHKFSNTLQLWKLCKSKINSKNINEIQIENGNVLDCNGCSFKTCLHFAKQKSCFYGGLMTKDVFPAIEKANIIIWLCPNYNDSIAANLTATINRLTALYNRVNFNDKSLFGIVVSGNSGSDSVAKQLIGALNINKGFYLPKFSMLQANANDPKEILTVSNIEEKALNFAKVINNLKKERI